MRNRRSPHTMSAAAVLLVGVALLLAACGGSEESAADSAPAADTAATAAASPAGESGSIVFDGLVGYPMTFTALDMDYMEWHIVTADDPDLGPTEYEGVLLSEVFAYVGVQPGATSLVITASDGSTVEIALADIADDDAMIAVADDDSLNVVMPGLESEASVEDVVAMELE